MQDNADHRWSKMNVLTLYTSSESKPHSAVAFKSCSISSRVKGWTWVRTDGNDFSLALGSVRMRSVANAHRKKVFTIDQ